MAMRLHYFDSLRALLMVAGIFYHAGLIYAVGYEWRVDDSTEALPFNYLVAFLSAFRMPLFFLVAGFFCALTYERYRARTNLYRRLINFGVPFLLIALTIQPLQYTLLLKVGDAPLDLGTAVGAFFMEGHYVSHLWFLLNLMIYYVVLYVLIAQPRIMDRIEGLLSMRIFESKAILAAVLWGAYVPCYVVLAQVTIIPGLYLHMVIKYFPFFLLGYVAYKRRDVFDALMRIRPLDAGLCLIVAVGYFLSDGLPDDAAKLVRFYYFYLAAFVLGAVVLQVFKRFFAKPRRSLRIIADASYTIYLFHQILVVVLGLTLMDWLPAANPYLKYALVCAITLCATLAFHLMVVRRFGWARLVVNGRLNWGGDKRAATAITPRFHTH